MDKKYHYVYLTTNLITGKQYVGDRSCDILPEEDQYIGTGILLLKKIKEYGKNNFNKEILEIFESREEASVAEEKYINEYNTLAPNGYNLHKKGGTSFSEHSDKSKGKMNKWRTGKSYEEIYGKEKAKEVREKIKENHAKYWEGKKKDLKIVEKSAKGNRGRKQSPETKEKIRQALLGKKHTEERRKNISNALKGKDFSPNFRKEKLKF